MSGAAMSGGRQWRAIREGALGLWAGALLMTGATAAVAFPTMRELAPALPGFSAYPNDHWSIGAGHIMQRVFAISDWTQLACAGIVLVTLGAELATSGRKRLGMAWRVRAGVILAAVGCLAFGALVLSPRMNGLLDVYWEAAKAGNIESAQAAKASFDADHVLARRVMTATFALVIAALLTSAMGGAGVVGSGPRRVDS